MFPQLRFLVLSGAVLTSAQAAEPESVSFLPDFVVETRSFKPPGSSKPGAMMFPPEPIRLLEVKTRQSRALQSAICANRRRPRLKAEQTVKIVLSDSLFVSTTRTDEMRKGEGGGRSRVP